MDRDQLFELVPHYIAMVLLVLLTLAAVETLYGELGFWPELGLIFVVAFAYRPVVVRLGVGPGAWEG